jgi:rare lipoprotein A (peptidoglycan hydrolase)
VRPSNCLHALRAALALMCLIFVASCASRQEPPPEPAPQVAPAPPPPAPHASHSTTKQVRASFMGTKPAGRPTASGEAYDPNELTAASKTLPLGSTVEVTNPSNGRSVRVRINDRGPYVKGRSIDLSKRAAEEIGLTEKGVGKVKIRRVDSKPAAHATPGLSEARRSKPSEASGSKPNEPSRSETPPLAPGVTAISTSPSTSASSANSDH